MNQTQRTQVEHEGSRRWAYGYGDLGQVETAQKQHYASSGALMNDVATARGRTLKWRGHPRFY